jgi:hypothetical protein
MGVLDDQGGGDSFIRCRLVHFRTLGECCQYGQPQLTQFWLVTYDLYAGDL